jgi:hypothetical protein
MPKATQTLPESYRLWGSLDITRDRRIVILMNLFGLILFIFFAWVFIRAMIWLRPEDTFTALQFGGDLMNWLWILAWVIGVNVLMIFVHEGFHGLFFWIFTGSRPKFAFKGWYAYAAAPGWYLPRNQYFVVGLAPLVLISLIGTALFAIVPTLWLQPLLGLLVFNASGAVGDILVTGWLLRQPPDCFAQDQGDAVALFRQG